MVPVTTKTQNPRPGKSAAKVVQNPRNQQHLRRCQEGQGEGGFPRASGFAKCHDLGVVRGGASHQEGESIARGTGPTKQVRRDRAGAFGADFNDGGGNEGKQKSQQAGSEKLLEGVVGDEGLNGSGHDEAEEDPAENHPRFAQARLEHAAEVSISWPDVAPDFGEAVAQTVLLGDVDGVGILRQGASLDEEVGDAAADDSDHHREDDEGKGPLPADEPDEDQGEREGVPRTGNEEGDDLTERGSFAVELHADHENAMVAEVEQGAGKGRAEDSAGGAPLSEEAGDHFLRYLPQHSDGGNPHENAPPRFGHQLPGSVGEGLPFCGPAADEVGDHADSHYDERTPE